MSHLITLRNSNCDHDEDALAALCILLYTIHLTRRLFESFFVHDYSTSSVQSVVVHLLGIGFYIVAVVSMFTDTCLLSSHSSHNRFSSIFELFSRLSIVQYLLVALFFLAMFAQNSIHRSLRDLRLLNSSSSYLLPQGGAFCYVCCPHYTSEIMIYLALALLRSHMLQTLTLIWTASNLIVTGQRQLRWYTDKFRERVPRNWKSVIPFVI